MSDLKAQMKQNMELRGFSPKTQYAYLNHLRYFQDYFQRPIESMGTDEIKKFLHFCITKKKVSRACVNTTYSALKFMYESTLGRQWDIRQIPRAKKERRLPVALSPDEIQRLFAVTTNLKHKAILMTTYGAGLRVSEVVPTSRSPILTVIICRSSSDWLKAGLIVTPFYPRLIWTFFVCITGSSNLTFGSSPAPAPINQSIPAQFNGSLRNPEIKPGFQQYGGEFRQTHRLPLNQLKVMSAIEACRTSSLGGHVDECDSCGHVRISYNSCRNRHCPKCQGLTKERWLLERERDLLNVGYFHVVFTIPDSLNPLTLRNQKEVYSILFKVAAETLSELARDPKYLGAQIGIVTVLHTWGQNLLDHPHLHCIVPGGGLSSDGLCWIQSKKKFFIPVKVLSRKFRGKFLTLLKQAVQDGKIEFCGQIAVLSGKRRFQELIDPLYQTEWVVYCKKPFKSP